MNKIPFLTSLGFGIVASIMLSLGLGGLAAKFDPVASKAKSISSTDTGHIASLPCIGGGGGGGDPVDALQQGERHV
jgi:hypothetical protein